MLQNILLDIENLIKNSNLINKEEIEKFLSFIKWFNKGEYIYPGALIANLDISTETAYQLLRLLEKNNITSKSFEVYCHACREFKGKIFDSFSDVPDEMYCSDCGKKLDPINDTIVIYRIINIGSK